jgi:hypothetical protein
MRERTTLVGGSVQTGPADGGGFLVHATLPIEGAPSEGSDTRNEVVG